MKKYSITLLFLSQLILAFSQKSDFQLFKSSIDQIQNEAMDRKEEVFKKAEASKMILDEEAEKPPKVEVMGGSNEENQKIAEVVEQAIKEELGMAEKTEKKETKPQWTTIKFKTQAMFPDQEKGTEFTYTEGNKDVDKVEWVDGGSFETTETIYIDDIKDPDEKQRLKEMSEHQGNYLEAKKIQFIQAIYSESETEEAFNKLMLDMKTSGFDFSQYFEQAKVLDNDPERVAFIKSKLESIIDTIIYR